MTADDRQTRLMQLADHVEPKPGRKERQWCDRGLSVGVGVCGGSFVWVGVRGGCIGMRLVLLWGLEGSVGVIEVWMGGVGVAVWVYRLCRGLLIGVWAAWA